MKMIDRIKSQTRLSGLKKSVRSSGKLAHFAVAGVLVVATLAFSGVTMVTSQGVGKAKATLGTVQYGPNGTWFAMCKTYRNGGGYGNQWDVTVLLDRGNGLPYGSDQTGFTLYPVRYPNGYSGSWQYTGTPTAKAFNTWIHNGANGHDWMGLTLTISGDLADGIQVGIHPNYPSTESFYGIFIPGDASVMPTC